MRILFWCANLVDEADRSGVLRLTYAAASQPGVDLLRLAVPAGTVNPESPEVSELDALEIVDLRHQDAGLLQGNFRELAADVDVVFLPRGAASPGLNVSRIIAREEDVLDPTGFADDRRRAVHLVNKLENMVASHPQALSSFLDSLVCRELDGQDAHRLDRFIAQNPGLFSNHHLMVMTRLSVNLRYERKETGLPILLGGVLSSRLVGLSWLDFTGRTYSSVQLELFFDNRVRGFSFRQRLLDYCTNYAAALGCRHVCLSLDAGDSLKPFYTGQGFTVLPGDTVHHQILLDRELP